MLLHKIFLVTSQKLHLLTLEKHVYIKTRTLKATMAPTKILLSFSAIKAAKPTGNNWKENRGKALRPLKVSKLLRKKPKKWS